jgi:hypothetical protein
MTEVREIAGAGYAEILQDDSEAATKALNC